MKKIQIEQVPVETLIPYANNAKRHDDAQVASIAASIREFGFNNPVLVDKDNGIIAGHGRVLAARKLEMETIPCLRLSHLTDAQKRAYILADNRLAEMGGGWNQELLKIEIESLLENGSVDPVLTGFSESEIERMIGGGEEAEDHKKEWDGMPEYEGLEPCFRKLVVNFDREEDVTAFFAAIRQSYTEKTKSIWFPEKERRNLKDQVWGKDE